MFATVKDALLLMLRDVTFAKVISVKSDKHGGAVYGHAVAVRTLTGVQQSSVRGKHYFFHKSDETPGGWHMGPINIHTCTDVQIGDVLAAHSVEFSSKERGRPVLKNWVKAYSLIALRDMLRKYRAKPVPKRDRTRLVRDVFMHDNVQESMGLGDEAGMYVLARIALCHDLKFDDAKSLSLEHGPRHFVFYLAILTKCPDLYKAYCRIADGGLKKIKAKSKAKSNKRKYDETAYAYERSDERSDERYNARYNDDEDDDSYSLSSLVDFLKYMGHDADSTAPSYFDTLPPHIRLREQVETVGQLVGMTRRWHSGPASTARVKFPLTVPKPWHQKAGAANKLLNAGGYGAIQSIPPCGVMMCVFCSRYSDGDKFIATVSQHGVINEVTNGDFNFVEGTSRSMSFIDPYAGTMLLLHAVFSGDESGTKNDGITYRIADVLCLGGYLLTTHDIAHRLDLASRLVDSGVFVAPNAKRLSVVQFNKRISRAPREDWMLVPLRGLCTRDGMPHYVLNHTVWMKWMDNAWHMEPHENAKRKKPVPANRVFEMINDFKVFPPICGSVYCFRVHLTDDGRVAATADKLVQLSDFAHSIGEVKAVIEAVQSVEVKV